MTTNATARFRDKKGPAIKEIIITPIAIVDPPLLNAAGLHAPYALRTIVELITEDNISGISEIPGNRDIDAALESARDLLIGKDPFQLNGIRSVLENAFGRETAVQRGETPWDQRKLVHIFSAIEVACMDIIGKVTGLPVVDMLGGKMRDRVPFAAYLFYKYEGAGGQWGFGLDPHAQGWRAARQAKALDPAGIVAQATAMCSEFGFRSIKLKGGVFEPRAEVDAMLALRKAFGPNMPLRIDPNALWKTETAIQYGREMEGLLEYLEDPVRGQENMAKVRKSLNIPLATNMCTTSFDDIPGSISLGSEDIILSDHHFWGGLRVSIELSRICETFGPMVAGDPATALNEPHSIVIDESAAKRYFNSTDVVGKTLELENKALCKVTGVIRDIPEQSHFHFSFILAKPGVSRDFLQARVDATVDNYLSKQLQDLLHTSTQDMKKQGNYFKYHLMPLLDIHLHSNKSYEFEANGNINYVTIFSFIAVLIFLIACVNFMNLSTARSANRAKEVGIRKVAGSTKGHLILQFLLESVLLSFFSLLLALGIALLLLPMFNTLAGKELHAGVLFSGKFVAVLVAVVFLVGCLAGSYPAFYLSSFQPIQVLKGKIASGFKSSWLRSSLVVFQFTISIMLIIGTLVIYTQLKYIRSRELGFNREQVLVIHGAYEAGDPIKSFRQDLLSLSGVVDATLTGDLTASSGGYSQNGWFRDASMDAKRVTVMTTLFVDEHYIPTLGMKMVKGRNFSKDFPTDSVGIILNESAAELLGMKDPLTEKMYRPKDNKMTPLALHVVGVVKDFNFNSLHEKVGPLIMQLADSRGKMAIRLRPGTATAMVRQIEAKWQTMARGLPFSYTFMDNDFNNLYHAEQQTGQVFITFAIFAILIACLGLFGLVTYAAEQRMKEIGVRKVLGAKVTSIVALLSKDFTKLVLISALIAFPLSWWGMNQWLQDFAYRIGVSWWIFVVAGSAAMLIALLTVSVQTIRAALANPVKSLRSE